jgi:putative hydrolase of the HAD superfamily
MIEWVIFDGGNTVVREFPYEGPMCDWPQVEAMPGIEDALRALQPDFRLAMASNAMLSGAAEMRKALARVGLDAYFIHCMTARDMGIGKLDPGYYAHVLDACGTTPDRAVMVGDTFVNDILAAKRAGLRAVWYNFNGDALPSDAPELPDATIRALADLNAAIRALK